MIKGWCSHEDQTTTRPALTAPGTPLRPGPSRHLQTNNQDLAEQVADATRWHEIKQNVTNCRLFD